MIAKYSTGNGFSGALKYDVRAGKNVVPEQIRVLDASGVRIDYDDDCNMVVDTNKVAWDFRYHVMTYKGSKPIRKPVYHFALNYHPNDIVSDEQMVEDAKEFLEYMGFDNTQYVMIAHRDKEHPHLHIVTNIVDKNGKRISSERMTERLYDISVAITKKKGYTWGEPANDKTIENAHKPHEKVRMIIKPIIKKALKESVSFEQLQEKLEKHGISCIVKQAADGKRGGISFGYEYDGQTHSYSGSSVNRQLSFAYINKSIAENEIASRTVTYIIHSRRDASIYYLGPYYEGSYKVLEPLRKALVDRGYMVSFEGKEGYERDLRMHKKYPDFRIGRMRLEDDKVRFGKEQIFGDPEITAPAFAQTPEAAPRPATQPAHQPRVKTVHELSKLKNIKSGGQESTKEAINKSELIDNEKKPGIKI